MLLLIDHPDRPPHNLAHSPGKAVADVVVRRNDALDVADARGVPVRAEGIHPEYGHAKPRSFPTSLRVPA